MTKLTASDPTSPPGVRGDLLRILRPVARRIRFHDGQRLAARSLWLPLLAAILILLAGRLFPVQGYLTWAWIPAAVWGLSVLSHTWIRPLPADYVAWRTDTALGLRSRLTTALELNYNAPRRRTRFDDRLVERQYADALTVARTIEPAHAFPLRWPWRNLTAAAACLIAVVLLLTLPNPMDAVRQERAAIATEAETQAEALEQLADELAEDEMLDPEERDELLRQLREAIEALQRNPGDREQALVDLAELEVQLRNRLDPQNAARQATLSGLTADLAALAGAEDRDPVLEEASRLLAELAASANDRAPSEQAALAQALEEAASRLAGSDPALAGALSQLASDVRTSQATESGAQAAASALEQAARDAALQQMLARTLNQTQNIKNAMTQAGQPESAVQASSLSDQTEGEAQAGDQSGQPQSGGLGSVQGQGTSGSSGGTQSPSGQPSTRSGRAGDPTDPNKAYVVGELDTVYAPRQQGEPGDPDFLPGRQTGQGQETIRENQQLQPGAPGAATVPYTEVYPSYAAAAASAIERDYVPAGLRDYVREYFSRLEP